MWSLLKSPPASYFAHNKIRSSYTLALEPRHPLPLSPSVLPPTNTALVRSTLVKRLHIRVFLKVLSQTCACTAHHFTSSRPLRKHPWPPCNSRAPSATLSAHLTLPYFLYLFCLSSQNVNPIRTRARCCSLFHLQTLNQCLMHGGHSNTVLGFCMK